MQEPPDAHVLRRSKAHASSAHDATVPAFDVSGRRQQLRKSGRGFGFRYSHAFIAALDMFLSP
jgi:hypothetical protein